MSVSRIDSWRRSSCGARCSPRYHDLDVHEGYGVVLALMVQRASVARVIRTGPMVIDLDTQRVTVDGALVSLTGREYGVLAYLAERIDRPCDGEDIMAAVWGPEWVMPTQLRRHSAGKGYVRCDRAHLNTVTCRLRARLGVAGRLVTASNGGGVECWRRLVAEEPT